MNESGFTSSREFFKATNYPSIINNNYELILITWHLKTPENIGSLIRLAANMGLKKVIFINNKDTLLRISKIKRTARDAEKFIEVHFASEDELINLIQQDYKHIALETSFGSKNIYKTTLPAKLALYLGNEITGLPQSLLSKMDECVHIPTPGPIPSMNVAMAGAVASFEWYRQMMEINHIDII
ncbi:MAG: TrmH family RNA methyltransferase [Marinilabiliaceae bacterium]|nr:TrmH family RNA methyltransferase [Marinilabiliaceae bacterium]